MLSSLSELTRLRTGATRSISAENPDGAPGGGGRATEGTGAHSARDLGRGWKVSPCIEVGPAETNDLAVIDGPGEIRHIWLTTHPSRWRQLVLRAHWDGAAEPAIEVPVGDFFGQGWGVFAQLSSVPVAVNPHGGFNCYWPMPFRQRARLSLENTGDSAARVYFQVTYQTGEPAGDSYLHAQWRRSNPVSAGGPHVLLDGVTGRGHYVGSYLAWGVNSTGWWGEGEMKFYLDGDEEFPTICGTGTEDYFGGAWNFDVPGQGYTAYSTPYLGLHQVIKPDGLYASQQRFGMYRWHIADPITFASRIRVDIQALGWRSGDRYRPLQDDIASTAYFYLDRPITTRPAAPTADAMEIG